MGAPNQEVSLELTAGIHKALYATIWGRLSLIKMVPDSFHNCLQIKDDEQGNWPPTSHILSLKYVKVHTWYPESDARVIT